MEFFHVFRGHAWSEECCFLELCLHHRVVTTYGEAAHKQRCRIWHTSRIISGKGCTALSPAGRTWLYIPRKLHWKSLWILLGEHFSSFYIMAICRRKKIWGDPCMNVALDESGCYNPIRLQAESTPKYLQFLWSSVFCPAWNNWRWRTFVIALAVSQKEWCFSAADSFVVWTAVVYSLLSCAKF